jgi:hypothetical protein
LEVVPVVDIPAGDQLFLNHSVSFLSEGHADDAATVQVGDSAERKEQRRALRVKKNKTLGLEVSASDSGSESFDEKASDRGQSSSEEDSDNIVSGSNDDEYVPKGRKSGKRGRGTKRSASWGDKDEAEGAKKRRTKQTTSPVQSGYYTHCASSSPHPHTPTYQYSM